MDFTVSVDAAVSLHIRHQPGACRVAPPPRRPGSPGDYRPFVLLHGLGANARLWDEVADRLAAAGHPVYAIDMRGHGESDSPENGYDNSTFIEDLAAVCQEIGLTSVLMAGHSWGGSIAVRFAAEHPALVCGLALLDGCIDPRFMGEWDAWAGAVQQSQPEMTGVSGAEGMRSYLRALHPSWSSRSIDAKIAEWRVEPDGSLTQRLSTEKHLSVMRSLWEDPPSNWYPKVQVPVLLLGSAPQITAKSMWNTFIERCATSSTAAAIAAMPQSESFWYRGVDHNMHAERPDLVANDLLGFARTCSASPEAGAS